MESIESSTEGDFSQRDDLQLESNPLLDHLFLSAEERQDYETLASPPFTGLPDREIPQQMKVQTQVNPQSQVISQAQSQMPQAQPQATTSQAHRHSVSPSHRQVHLR